MSNEKKSSLQYSISKNHPLPEYARSETRGPIGTKYPLKDMDIGDSFLEVEDGLTLAAMQQRIQVAKKFLKIESRRFTYRLVQIDDGKTGIRVWRSS